jgi:hypothetical protein
MSKNSPDRRDELLSDLYEDQHGPSLPAQMAARVRLRRRIRAAGAACVILTVAGIALFQSSRYASQELPSTVRNDALTSSAPQPSVALPPANIATDADLMAALEHESVMIFTLADGQRQVVWLDGKPRS